MALSNRSGTHAPLPVLLRNNLLVAAFIFALLELWLPCFFLTDDNLSAGYPVYTEIGLRLLHGHSPFVSQWLFGGNYDLHTDPMFFNWHPVYLLVSLLAGTPAHFFMIDAAAFVFFLLAAAGFTYLAHILREELALELSDGWLMFYTLSYTYSFLMIATGASWLSFLGNHSALPWLAAGILQKTWRRGLGLVTLFSLHHILGGHLAPFISSTIFLTLFAGGVAIWRRSLLPLVSWGAGLGLALLVALPLLLPVFQGFLGSHRADGLTVEGMQNSRVPLFVAPGSYLVGTALWLVKHPSDFHVYHPALAACAAAWCLFPALLGRSHWRFLPALCLGLVILVSILVIRPVWLSQAIIQVPVLRALRMPFRELLIFEFFLHLFLVTRPPAFSETVRRAVGGWSLAVFLIPMLLYAPPSFNPMKQERRLLFSGEFDAYWQQVHTHLRPEDRVAVVIPDKYYVEWGDWAPFALLGTHDFCCLAHFRNASGYSVTVPADQLYLQTPPVYFFGAFLPKQISDLWKEQPGLKLIVLENLHPLKIVLRAQDNPDVDLTPYAPHDLAYP